SAQVAVSAPNAKPHENLKSFRKVLQHSLSLSNTAWSYNIPGFPPPEATNRLGLTKSLIVKTEGLRHQILLQLQPISENRATKQDPLDSFVLVSFANFNARTLRNQSREAVGTQPATAKECTEYAVKMLRAGVTIQGLHYNFYGHSNSQLKSRTCFLFVVPKDVIRAKVAALGDFSKMKTVQKKAKRIGLLFSVAQVAMTIDPSRVEDIPDIESADGSYVFTDGCGLIAPRLAQELSRRVGIKFRDARYTPSVFQIRYRGYKGVVTVDPRMRAEAGTWLKLRKSMKKFSGGDDHSFSVVQYSKPYAFGHLNDEVILLLHSLGISSAILLQKQREHFDFFAQAVQNPILAFRFLTYVNRFDLAEKVVLGSLDEVRDQIHKLVKIEHSKMIKNEDQQRCRILIRQSRILFGVCDAWDVLQEGECHVCITHCDGQARALKNAEVLVTRNPCLHPGDLQKFRVVYKPELAHMVDAIVFSTRGKRPAADLMSGGDLDGDTFFVCWDKELIPSTVSQPAEYPGAKEPVSFNAITDDDRLVYFAKYNNGSLGRVKNLYLDWARAHGPMSPECQELNRLFSTCVDGNQIKVPPRLETAPKPPEDAPPFILDELHDNAASIIKTWQALSRDFKGSEEYSAEAIDILLSRDADDLTISEFELIQLAWRWCKKNDSQFEDVFHLFDFNLLNAEEKAWALSKVPMKVEYLRLHELYDFKLHYPGIGWKRIFSSTEDRLATFLETVAHSFELFHRKLIVYRVDERLTLAIYVPLKIKKSRECRVDGKVRLFAFPHTKGEERSSRLCLPTKINYQLYCDDNVFQLFENHRSNTWVYISRGPSNDSQYRNVVSTGDRRRARQGTIDKGVNVDFRTSVALDKFSKGLQTHIGRVNRNGVMGVEVYVISNRDTKSLRNLDLWLEYIDTQKVVPLFEQNAKGYTIETLKTVSWAEVPPHIHRIVKRDDLITLLTLDSAAQYAEVFTWLLARDQKERVAFGAVPAETVIYQMMASVEQCPVLAVSFSRLDSWESLPEEVLDVVQVLAEGILLKALVLSASVVGQIMVDPFKTILSRINVLSIQAYARLAELIALTVHSPDLALDLLLEGLEKESHRLIPHRPAIIRHAVKNLVGIAIDHVGEAAEQSRTREDLLDLKLVPESEDGYTVVEAEFRIDSRGGTPEKSAHVRLIAASPLSNSLMGRVCSVDALVISSSPGSAKFKCFHPMPEFVERCSWKLQYCGPFVTTKTMFESVLNLALSPESCCEIYGPIMGIRDENTESGLFLEPSEIFYARLGELNESQNAAVFSALRWPLTCLWGPPGTGKTHTIVEIIKQIQRHHKGIRLLVTAPTHNAVDNVMRRYLKDVEQNMASPLRVST
ncbi:RNA dependent RNA polymerase-domain-containing protein, partial [Podospora didyma]